MFFSSHVQRLRIRGRANQESDLDRVMVLSNALHQGKEVKCMCKRVIIKRTLQSKPNREGSEVVGSMDVRSYKESRITGGGILEKEGS